MYIIRAIGFGKSNGEAVKRNFTKMIPLGRYASNEDIHQLTLFPGSDNSCFITGSTYVRDGGFTR